MVYNKLFFMPILLIFRQIGIAYVSATSSAVAVSVGLNTLVKVRTQYYLVVQYMYILRLVNR